MSKYFDTKNLTFMEPKVIENGNHMIMTNVHNEQKTKYINIDTRFQQEYNMNTTADYVISLPQTLRDVQSMKMISAEIPISFFPFSLAFKNTYFKVTHGSSPQSTKVVVIDDGNYTITTLLSEINAKIDISNLSIAESEHNTCTIENTTGNPVTIDFAVDEAGNDDKYMLKSKLGWCLGFRNPTYIIGDTLKLHSESLYTLQPCKYLYLSIDDYHSHNPNSFLVPGFQSFFDTNILARISLNPFYYNYGTILVANSNSDLISDIRSYKGKTDIQKLRIILYNEFGEKVDLNDMDISFALELKCL